MSYTQAQEEILARLRTIKNVPVYEGIASSAVLALFTGPNQMNPFLTVDFGALVSSHRPVKGIVGAAADTHEGNIIVHSVANDMQTARRVIQSARDVLLGFIPTNCGQLVPETYGGIGEVSGMVNPTRYSQVQPFVYLVNSDKTE